jgi:hypothetical protein
MKKSEVSANNKQKVYFAGGAGGERDADDVE